ncbi:hypothetical protein CHS0354_032973 [Potamilus streckersoni]|uniref:Uncharacterized protein n=1 Tax=Potamilus streckersoni TaxID=2493646 RepID=A0AAE0VKS5_9BIVA|nr:hypothetical protein CHS0354_032973 [Potamilus streckersoni]
MLCIISVKDAYACPQHPANEAFSCFRDYSSQKLNLDSSERQLYSGIDVEILRAFCSSFKSAMTCISQLIRTCPQNKHSDIEMALVNFQGSETVLANLCQTEDLYEKYAQYQTCFYTRGLRSQKCFQSSFNSSIHLMSSFEDLSLEDICSKLRKTKECIRLNIAQGCGQKAADLVELLINPMIRKSNHCDLHIAIQTVTPQHGRIKSFADEKNVESRTYRNNVSNSSLRPSFGTNTVIIVLFISNIITLRAFS